MQKYKRYEQTYYSDYGTIRYDVLRKQARRENRTEREENFGRLLFWGGNTKAAGDYIAQKLGADIHQIQTVKPYPTDYDSCVAVVGKQGKEYEPELQLTVPDIADYDVIFMGTPCWWSNISNLLRSFLHQHSFKGKTVIPFMTNGTSGNKLQSVKKLCPDADVLDGLSIFNRYQVETKINTPDNMGNWEEEVDEWLNKITTR